MHWWWFGLSLIGGIVVFLADLYRHQVKRGKPWLGKNRLVTLAFYIPFGAGCGWVLFYYVPQVVYRGAVGFIHLYNDPTSPLLKLVPGLVGILTAVAVMHCAAKAWGGAQLAWEAGLHRKSLWLNVLAFCLWAGSATLIFVGCYFTIILRRS
jgi:hypothetical protein